MELTVREKPYNRQTYKLINELPERYAKIIESLPSASAELLRAMIEKEAPKNLVPDYPDFLKVYEYVIQGSDYSAGVVAPGYAHAVRVTGKEATHTVIFVKAKRPADREPDPGALLLEENGPWTVASLPYEPDRFSASMKARRERQVDVQNLEAQRLRDRRDGLDNKLIALGYRLDRPDTQSLVRKVSFDIAHAVLRAEYGLGDVKKAHWRPAVRKLRSLGIRGVLKDMQKWLAPNDATWKRGVPVKAGQQKDVKRVQDFQDRVAVR